MRMRAHDKATPYKVSPLPYGRGIFRMVAALMVVGTMSGTAWAIDPPYQRQMERLSEVMGSLYYLGPLCKAGDEDWRAEMGELIELDQPDDDRRQRLAGAFNNGVAAYSRTHKQCTASSREALNRLTTEAARIARDIHTRYAE